VCGKGQPCEEGASQRRETTERTEEDDGGTEHAAEVLRSGADGVDATNDGGVLLLERDADLGGEFDHLELHVELILGCLGVDATEGLPGAFKVAREDGEARRLGKPVHRDTLTESEGQTEGEQDPPAVVDLLETGADGVGAQLSTGDHAIQEGGSASLRAKLQGMNLHALHGDDAATVHAGRDLAEVDGADDGSDTSSSSHEDATDDELDERVGGADEDSTENEEDVADDENALATDSEGVGGQLAGLVCREVTRTHLSEYEPPKIVPKMAPTEREATAHWRSTPKEQRRKQGARGEWSADGSDQIME
jgi:hypothetical protein